MTGMLMPQFWTEAEQADSRGRAKKSGRSLLGWLVGSKAKAKADAPSIAAAEQTAASRRYLADLW